MAHIYNMFHWSYENNATILVLEANLELRIAYVLTLNSIIRDGNRYRLNIFEDKTDKR
ncbi:MAG: hypothetical protein MUO60_11350 [Clostridiaceae bacterium]|nr:hypothetical protein [Clostridiaceae bacterium]